MENTDLIREIKELTAQEIAEKCKKEGLKLIIENGKVTGVKRE